MIYFLLLIVTIVLLVIINNVYQRLLTHEEFLMDNLGAIYYTLELMNTSMCESTEHCQEQIDSISSSIIRISRYQK